LAQPGVRAVPGHRLAAADEGVAHRIGGHVVAEVVAVAGAVDRPGPGDRAGDAVVHELLHPDVEGGPVLDGARGDDVAAAGGDAEPEVVGGPGAGDDVAPHQRTVRAGELGDDDVEVGGGGRDAAGDE